VNGANTAGKSHASPNGHASEPSRSNRLKNHVSASSGHKRIGPIVFESRRRVRVLAAALRKERPGRSYRPRSSRTRAADGADQARRPRAAAHNPASGRERILQR
jgi:hypothetical protein